MTDLRKAGENLIKSFEQITDDSDVFQDIRIIGEHLEALRQALAQPEKRGWVGLTDEEIKDFIATFPIIFTPDDLVIFARAILRKAQEK